MILKGKCLQDILSSSACSSNTLVPHYNKQSRNRLTYLQKPRVPHRHESLLSMFLEAILPLKSSIYIELLVH